MTMIRYNDAGLRNVWLQNGYEARRTHYGTAIAVRDADALALAISKALVEKRGRLSGGEFRYLRLALRLSQKSLSRMLGNTEQTVALWEARGRVPLWADRQLRLLWLARHEGNREIGATIERLNTVERLLNERIVMQERRGTWKPRIEVAAA
jgi:DNA-binding transcriptional regulator YiaG